MKNLEKVVLGGGCFWCIEAVFSKCKGVTEVLSGYAGGEGENSYEEVCEGNTGHAEVVQVTFDPEKLSLQDVLHIFFAVHDPTTMNRQGNDVGTQYRSVIYYTNEQQMEVAMKVIADLQAQELWGPGKKIVTEVTALKKFYEAENYHQKYYENNAWKPYCQVVIAPKLGKFREKYAKFYRMEGEEA